MEPPTRLIASPGLPLFDLSPERLNGTRPPYSGHVPQSPSMPEFGKPSMSIKPSLLTGSPENSPFRHSRSSSSVDAHVQGMVARFDGLSIRDFKANSEVAVRRADMAREMAEMERDQARTERKNLEDEYKKMKEEMRKMKKEMEESKERERKAGKRIEAVMEDYKRSKENHEHAVNIYEKEIRKSRKEAFKSASSLVKIQEELKATRNSLRITQSGLESEKVKTARREQEAFTAQYQLIGMQEELQKAQERIKVVEDERDALKTSLQEEEVARIAVEGRIALPAMDEDDDELLHSPRKSPRKPRLPSEEVEADKENRVPKKMLELQSIYEELAMERRLKEKAQELIEFMKMECQFECCSCRLAEKSGHPYVHDGAFVSDMAHMRRSVGEVTPPVSDPEDIEMIVGDVAHALEVQVEMEKEVVDGVDSYDHTSFHAASEPSQVHIAVDKPEKAVMQVEVAEELEAEVAQEQERIENKQEEDEEGVDIKQEEDEEEAVGKQYINEVPEFEPQTPVHEMRTITTKTTIPIMFSPFPERGPATPNTVGHAPAAHVPASPFFPASAFKADGTLDRAAALAQIKERRDRARSVNMGQATPRKQMVEGAGGRRDISAPTLKSHMLG